MKIMIRSFQLAFTGLIFLSLAGSSTQCFAQGEKAKSEITAYTKSNLAFSFSDTSDYFIILKNNHFCINCFLTLDDYVIKLKESLRVKFIALCISDSMSLERKRNYAEAKNILPDIDEVLFQYSSNKENMFLKNDIQYSPEIALLSRGKLTIIPYQDIFDISSMQVTLKTQNKILKILNAK